MIWKTWHHDHVACTSKQIMLWSKNRNYYTNESPIDTAPHTDKYSIHQSWVVI
jgi:hypothetical protein